MKKLFFSILTLGILLFYSFMPEVDNDKKQKQQKEFTSCTDCATKFPEYIDDVDITDWPNYKFDTEFEAKKDLEKKLRRNGFFKFSYKGWQPATDGPAEKYKGFEHQNMGFYEKGKNGIEEKVSKTTSLVKGKVCTIKDGKYVLDTYFGWVDNKKLTK